MLNFKIHSDGNLQIQIQIKVFLICAWAVVTFYVPVWSLWECVWQCACEPQVAHLSDRPLGRRGAACHRPSQMLTVAVKQ